MGKSARKVTVLKKVIRTKGMRTNSILIQIDRGLVMPAAATVKASAAMEATATTVKTAAATAEPAEASSVATTPTPTPAADNNRPIIRPCVIVVRVGWIIGSNYRDVWRRSCRNRHLWRRNLVIAIGAIRSHSRRRIRSLRGTRRLLPIIRRRLHSHLLLLQLAVAHEHRFRDFLRDSNTLQIQDAIGA
jgi:hypothetical protein